jgi:hypothetical protein
VGKRPRVGKVPGIDAGLFAAEVDVPQSVEVPQSVGTRFAKIGEVSGYVGTE